MHMQAFSPAIDQALILASIVHREQPRKKTDIPYIGHPVHVALILERRGWPEHLVIAGLLHDVLEDVKCENEKLRNEVRSEFREMAGAPDAPADFRKELEAAIEREFGKRVLELVRGITEVKRDESGKERAWETRKLEALERLRHADAEGLALKGADLLHNVSTIVRDLRAHGAAVVSRFNAGAARQVWGYGCAADIVCERLGEHDPLARELRIAIQNFEHAMSEVCGVKPRPRDCTEPPEQR